MTEIKIKETKCNVLLSTESVLSEVIFAKLCHGDRIVELVTGDEDVSSCDALFTQNQILKLGIRTADCAPVCFSDGKNIGIAHVGWRGLCLGLVEKMLENFSTKEVIIYVGPFLHMFEVQKDFCYDMIINKFGEKYFIIQDDKIFFSFRDALAVLLPEKTIFDERNTGSDLNLPSYRRDKTKGRISTVISF